MSAARAWWIGALLAVAGSLLCHADATAQNSGSIRVVPRVVDKADAAPGAAFNLYPKSYALVIGIDDYDAGWPRLGKAIEDARAIDVALRKRGFETELVLDPDREQLENAFETFFIEKGADRNARLFVWYAGHGFSADNEGYLIPRDAPEPDAGTAFFRKALSMRRFGEWARAAKAKHVLAVFDSCFAGTIFQTARGRPPAAITAAVAEPVRQFLTSGDAGQEVSDDGMFRELFIGALDGKEKADANNDGYLTGTELGFFLSDRLTNLTDRVQTPRYGKLPDPRYDRGDFVLATLVQPTIAKPAEPPAASPRGTGFDPRQLELAFWDSIKSSRNSADFDAYLQQFPQGLYAPIARNRLGELKVANVSPREEPQARASTPPPPAAPTPEALESALNLSRDDRILVQRSLQALGHDPRGFDGGLGPRSRAAVAAWQASRGEPATGYLTATQHGRLLAEASIKLAAAEVARPIEQPVAVEPPKPVEPPRARVEKTVGTFAAPIPAPGTEIDDCGGESWCPRLVVLPAGRFEQGATAAERSWYIEQGAKEEWAAWELPRRQVTIERPFAIGKYEVTIREYRRFADATGHKAAGCVVFDGARWEPRATKGWRDPDFPQSEDHPVVCVSWDDAQAYTRWLSKETGKPYRLSSESEWEYAARGSVGPTTAMRFWGDDRSNSEACSAANVADLALKAKLAEFYWPVMSCDDREVQTARVGRYRPNQFGLHDMLGNVWEWVADPWHDSYVGAPTDGSVWTMGGRLSSRVLRGGSWSNNPWVVRAAIRGRVAADNRGNDAGFRVARSLD